MTQKKPSALELRIEKLERQLHTLVDIIEVTEEDGDDWEDSVNAGFATARNVDDNLAAAIESINSRLLSQAKTSETLFDVICDVSFRVAVLEYPATRWERIKRWFADTFEAFSA